MAGQLAGGTSTLHQWADVLHLCATDIPIILKRLGTVASSPWTADTMAGWVSGGAISDPTGNTAGAREAISVRVGMIRNQRTVVAHAIAELDRLLRDPIRGVDGLWIDTVKITQQHRCHGMDIDGYDEWGDPTCEANAVTQDHLCDRCRQRRDGWRRKQQEQAAA